MLITISVLACFPQSVSADIFWRPWSFNTFTANRDALAAALMKHLLREKPCGVQTPPWELCQRASHTAAPLMRERTVFLGHVCRKISLGDTASPRQASSHMDSPVQNLASSLHRRRTADEGLSPNWAASRPHMFAQLAKQQERGLVLSAESQLLWSACIWPGMTLTQLAWPWKASGKDDSQGLRSLLCPLEWALFKGKWFSEDL